MVALAARHLLTEESVEAALQTYCPSLNELGPHNADTAGFTTIFLFIDAFATLRDRPRTRIHDNDGDEDGGGEFVNSYISPIQWLRIVRGARAVLEAVLTMANARGEKGNSQNGQTMAPTATKPMSILTIVSSYAKAHYIPSTPPSVSTSSPSMPPSDAAAAAAAA
ncbi:hypothetical protein PGQ11_009855 [Apiospora arundinis]|uniref:Uncharacterized protein n=1 Tax=Apiospora arundinis TaxID=335852 RepID=A0ABR2I8E9_9PEZI